MVIRSRGIVSAGYWKSPLMSRIRGLALLVNAVTAPLVPAGAKAALATIDPSYEFSVETLGMPPLPHNVRNPRGAGGTTVAFSEYAFPAAGMPQAEDATSNLPLSTPPILGP